MVKNGKLFCFIGAALFLINAIIFFVFHASIPILLGIASMIVAIAILVLALLPWLKIVLDIISIVASFVSAYLLTDAIRQMPTYIVVPSNLLVFLGFVLVLVGGVLNILWIKKYPSAKKASKSTETEDNSNTEKQKQPKKIKVKTPKIRKKKQQEYIPPPPPEYDLNNDFEFEPEVLQFIEYLKSENSRLLYFIGLPNIVNHWTYLKIPCEYVGLPNCKENRETVTPTFFTCLMKWVMNNYKLQHPDDNLLPYGLDFAISLKDVYDSKTHTSTPIMRLTVDSFSLDARANQLTKDEILEAKCQLQDKYHTKRDLTVDDFSSYIAWLAYKKEKENYEKSCQRLESQALTAVCNHTLKVIEPIARRLYNSLNIYDGHKYIVDKLVVDDYNIDAIRYYLGDSKTFLK